MELFKLFGTIAIDTEKANQALDDTTNKAKDGEQTQTDAFSKIGGAAVAMGKVIATAGAVIGGAWIAAIESTRQYRVSMGMLETAFTTAGHSADTAKQTYSDLNAVLGDSGQATEAAQQLAKLTDNEKDLQTWTNVLTGVYATFGESLPIEGLAEAANHTAKVGEVQGSLADALEWSGISVESFNDQLAKCSTEQERQELITKTMNELYGESAKKYKEVNKDVIAAEKAQEKLTDAMAQLGEVGEPILTAIKTKAAEMVSAAVPKLESMIQKIKDMRKWFKDNKDTVDTWVAVIIGATVAIGSFLLIMNFAALLNKAVTAIKAVRAAMLLLNAALKANPIGLVVSLIAGLVAAFIYLWNNNEGFRKFWLSMWEKVKSATSSAIKGISNKFNDLKAGFNKVKTIFSDIQKTMSSKMDSARSKVKSAIDKIKGFFNFKWSLPKLKMPTFTIKGKFGLNPPSVPKLSLKWNAEGGILTKPTIFGVNPATGTLLGGGEAGKEAIAPIDKLQAYVDESVNSRNMELIEAFEIQISRLILFLQNYFPADYKIMLDTGVLAGQLAPEMNRRLADILKNNRRGNV